MLLPLIQKILSVIILNRVSKPAMKRLSKGQNAYQLGRDTSEQALAVKLLHEKAVVTGDVPVHTKLIDIFEAFDNVYRNSKKCVNVS